MKNKIFAIVILSLIVAMIVGIIVYFVLKTELDVVAEAMVNETSIPILISFDYMDDESDELRVISMLLLLNPNTMKIGILEVPGYIGVYSSKSDFIVPIDKTFRDSGYKSYVSTVVNTFGIQDLNYLHVSHRNLSNFIDVIGGLKIFLINEEYEVVDSKIKGYSSGVGDMYFDGPTTLKYVDKMENISKNDELSKSARRKELIVAILKQIQLKNNFFKTSNKSIAYVNKYVDTSLTSRELKKIFVNLVDYNISDAYFQRISGRIRNISIPINKNKNNVKNEMILFSDSEVGGLAKVLGIIEDKLRDDIQGVENRSISLSILNGTVINGLARKTKKIYEDAGYKVLAIGNAERSDIETSIIIDRIGNKSSANLLADVIGIRSIITDITSVDDGGAEFTIILGKDFDGNKIK